MTHSSCSSALLLQFRELVLGQRLALLHPKEGIPLAILTIESMWKPNKIKEAIQGAVPLTEKDDQ